MFQKTHKMPGGSTMAGASHKKKKKPNPFAKGKPPAFAKGKPNPFAKGKPNPFAKGKPNPFAKGKPNPSAPGSDGEVLPQLELAAAMQKKGYSSKGKVPPQFAKKG